MENVPRRPRPWARRLLRWARKQRNWVLLRRAQVVAMAVRGRSAAEISECLGCARSHVYRTVGAFLEDGEASLADGRRLNGRRLANEVFAVTVAGLLEGSPHQHGYERPTWTRELLVRVAEVATGIVVSVSVMGRVLKRIGARRGRPKPIVLCRLSPRQQSRRLKRIRDLLANLARNEVAVYEDEADIHLNPKIGLDWMRRGVQKLVITPGKNAKAYVAGTLDARDRTVLWVGSGRKTGALFIAMLERLEAHYTKAKVIHVILDNYGIHSSGEVRRALARMPRIRLHFLPPYSPDENKIERLWQELHANVTRNHCQPTLEALCAAVARYLDAVSPWIPGRPPVLLEAT